MKKLLLIAVFLLICSVQAQAPTPVLELETVDITLNLEPKPYSFKFEALNSNGPTSTIVGRRFDSDTGADLRITIIRPAGSSKVGIVDAAVTGPNVSAATWLLPYVASVPIGNGQPAQSSAWVAANWKKVRAGKPFQKTIGPAVYELFGNAKTNVTLRIKHPKFTAWALSKMK